MQLGADLKQVSKAAQSALRLVAVLMATTLFTATRPAFATSPSLAGTAAPGQPLLSQEEARRYTLVCWQHSDGRPMDVAERSICQADAFRAAPDDRLIDVMRAKAAMAHAMLSLSPERCGEFLIAARSDWTPSSPALMKASTEFFRAVMSAQYAGATTPQKRNSATEDDRRVIAELMLKDHVERAEAEAALSGRPASLPAVRRCFAQAAMFDAVAKAPKSVAGRMAVRLVPMSSPYAR